MTAGTYKAESIRAVEAEFVIENTQRDQIIALINESAFNFNRMGIDMQAAGTKWNFISFRPDLGVRHWGRLLLPDSQGRGDQPSPADHPGRAPAV